MIENSMCYDNDITSDEFDMQQEPLIEIDYRKKEEKYHSILIIGNMKIRNTKKFNWFQRKMFKIFFGIEINNLESKGE